jgi:chromosome segregation ATPase
LKAEVEILRERENTANGRCEILIAELEKARNEIDSRDRNAVRVEEQLGIRESEARTLADQIEKLTTQNKNLLQRLESANNAIAATEVKLTHESKRHEDERSRMLDEKQKELL